MVAGISGTLTGVGSRVFDLTGEIGIVNDAVCQAAYNDDSAVFVASVGQCSGEGSVDVCVVCTGGEYPIGPSRACGECPPGEYRHPSSFTCEACPADGAECQAAFGSSGGSLDSSVTCGGLVSGCGGPQQCSPGYYGAPSDAGACVQCTGHSVGSVQRGAPVPVDEVAAAHLFLTPSSVALSGSGTVLALGFSYADLDGVGILAGMVRVYSWDGVAWVQRGGDIEGVSARGFFGNSVALSENGITVSGSAMTIPTIVASTLALFTCSYGMGLRGSPRGEPILGDQREGYLGLAMELSALGSVLVIAEIFDASLQAVHLCTCGTRGPATGYCGAPR